MIQTKRNFLWWTYLKISLNFLLEGPKRCNHPFVVSIINFTNKVVRMPNNSNGLAILVTCIWKRCQLASILTTSLFILAFGGCDDRAALASTTELCCVCVASVSFLFQWNFGRIIVISVSITHMPFDKVIFKLINEVQNFQHHQLIRTYMEYRTVTQIFQKTKKVFRHIFLKDLLVWI